MLHLQNNKSNFYLLTYSIFLHTFYVHVSPSIYILNNIGHRFTYLKNCILDVHLFPEVLTVADRDYHIIPPSLSQGKDQIFFWEDLLSHIVKINGDNSFIIENNKSSNKSAFSTVFSSEVAKYGEILDHSPVVQARQLVSNFRFFNRAFSTCGVNILLNYISKFSIPKRIFLMERSPFILRGRVNWGTVILISLQSPDIQGHGINDDFVGSWRVFFVRTFLYEEKILREAGQIYKNFKLGRFFGYIHFNIHFLCVYCPPLYFRKIHHDYLTVIKFQKTARVVFNVFLLKPVWNFGHVKFTSNEKFHFHDARLQGRRVTEVCKSSMRYRHGYACSRNARKIATLENLINISFVNEVNSIRGLWGGVSFTVFQTNIPGKRLNRLSHQFEQG